MVKDIGLHNDEMADVSFITPLHGKGMDVILAFMFATTLTYTT
jgi:hypothetical protein